MLILLTATGVTILLMAAVFGYGYRQSTRLPDNNPQSFLTSGHQKSGKIVVCVGDSITQASVSHNYVDELGRRFKSGNYRFVNAGVNSELAYNVLQRLDEIIRCDPDYITILIGTNDAQASLSEKKASHYVRQMNLPGIPDRQSYVENLAAIVKQLKKSTRAKIALLSLPPITEDRHHAAYLKAEAFSVIVRQTAVEYGLSYLPLNETFHKALAERGRDAGSRFVIGDSRPLYASAFYNHILGYSWDEIAQKNNLVYLTDNIHLSGKGAHQVADLIEGFIRNNPVD